MTLTEFLEDGQLLPLGVRITVKSLLVERERERERERWEEEGRKK